jgi:hypothetical protein
MNTELAKVLTEISQGSSEPTEENKTLLNHHLTDITQAADALVWIMRAARDPKFMQKFERFASQTLDNIFTLHPSLVIKKLSFATDSKQSGTTEIPESTDGGFPGSGNQGDQLLPQEEGHYKVCKYSARDPSSEESDMHTFQHLNLDDLAYRNYALRTPWQFATLFQLEPFQTVLEKHKVNKDILAKEDQFAPTRTNPSKQDRSVAAQVRTADLTAIQGLIQQDMSDDEALEVLVELLQKARFDPKLDKPISEFIKHLQDDHPFLNTNRPFKFAETRHEYTTHQNLIDPSHLFQITDSDSKLQTNIHIRRLQTLMMHYELSFKHASPLRLASIYNLKAIMKVLLEHRLYDLTVDPVYTASTNEESKKILHEAAIKQFYREAMLAPPNQKDTLLGKFKDFNITPSLLRDYALKQITSRVEAVKDPVQKLQLLNAEISKLPSNNALAAFLGKERDELEASLTPQIISISKTLATPASTGEARSFQEDFIKALEKAKKSDEKINSIILLNDILHKLVDNPSLDEVATQAIRELVETFPDLDLNIPDFGNYDREITLSDAKKPFPVINLGQYAEITYYKSYRYKRLNPLQIATLFNCDHLMQYLLAHPKVDITINSRSDEYNVPRNGLPTYFFAQDNTRCKALLLRAHLDQLYEALLDPTTEQDRISQLALTYEITTNVVTPYTKEPITAQIFQEYLLGKIMARVNEKTTREDKVKAIQAEINNLPADDHPISQFLGDERKTLEKNLLAEVGKITGDKACAADPTGATMITTQSINSVSNDLGRSVNTDAQPPTSGFKAKLSSFFTRK